MTGYFGTSWSLLKKKYVEGHTSSFILQCNFVTSACAWFNLQRNVTDTTDTLRIPTSFNMTFSPPLEYFCGYIFMQIPSKPLNHFHYPLVTQKWINVSSWQNIWFLGGIFSRLVLRCCTCVWQTYFRVFLWMCREELVYLCAHVWISLFHAEPSARGDNRHISLQTEAKQPFPAFSSWLRMTSSYYL